MIITIWPVTANYTSLFSASADKAREIREALPEFLLKQESLNF